MAIPRPIRVTSVCRPSCAVRTLFDETRMLADREGKTPVLTLAEKGKTGFIIVVAHGDLGRVLDEFRAARAAEEVD